MNDSKGTRELIAIDTSAIDVDVPAEVLRRLKPQIDEFVETYGFDLLARKIRGGKTLGMMLNAYLYDTLHEIRGARSRASLYLANLLSQGQLQRDPDAAYQALADSLLDLKTDAAAASTSSADPDFVYGNLTHRDELFFDVMADILSLDTLRVTKPGRLLAYQLNFEGFREEVRKGRALAGDPDTAFSLDGRLRIDQTLQAIDRWERLGAEIELAVRVLRPGGTIGS